MKQKTFIKAATLLLSLSLATAFILYRTGTFDSSSSPIESSIQQSSNGSVLKRSTKDTGALIVPFIQNPSSDLRASSSKVLILTDGMEQYKKSKPVFRYLKDYRKIVIDSTLKKRPVFFSGSKSSQIFDPSLLIDPRILDSINKIKHQ